LEHVIAAKAVAFGEDLTPEYKIYCEQVIKNAKAMSQAFMDLGYQVISGGTDNHLMLIDLRPKNLNGKLAENTLVKADITINKNMVPFDDKSPFVTSGMRIGTSAMTTRGFMEEQFIQVAHLIDEVLMNHENETVIAKVRNEVHQLAHTFPLYS
jgi:glycine hydroxymethyltransferase